MGDMSPVPGRSGVPAGDEMAAATYSPLRKSLGRTLTPEANDSDIGESNNENEERIHIRQKRKSMHERRSISGGVMLLRAEDISNKMEQCIKLSVENKITSENAFSLSIIDLMHHLVKNKNAQLDNFNVASAGLDASAKVYACRVDSTYQTLQKMKLSKQLNDKNMEARESQQDDDGDKENEGENGTQKKKKRKRRVAKNVLLTNEEISCNVETYDPMTLLRNIQDVQTTDMLQLNLLPCHANTKCSLHKYNDVILDQLPEPRKAPDSKRVTKLPNVNTDAMICETFHNFDWLSWNVENSLEKDDTPPDNPPPANDLRFDINASLAPEDDNIYQPFNDHEDEVYEESAFAACAAGPGGREMVDVVSIIRENQITEQPAFSYFQPKYNLLHWAGPSHWKAAMPSRRSLAPQAQRKKRTKKVIDVKNIESCMTSELKKIDKKLSKSKNQKLNMKTPKEAWAEEKIKLPEDVHFDVSSIAATYVKPSVQIGFPKLAEKVDSPKKIDDLENEGYNYDNEMDRTTEYVPPDTSMHQDGEMENDEAGNNDDMHNNSFGFSLTLAATQPQTQALDANNLVAAPRLANKVLISYATRAKKINMRHVKSSLWELLRENEGQVGETMEQTMAFTDVCKKLPSKLPQQDAQAISVALTFVSVLHLANEHGLELKNENDEIIIAKGNES